MSRELRYGDGEILVLNVPEQRITADCSNFQITSLEDPAAAVEAALADPLGFPPLTQITVPGDQIAIAVGRQVPRADAIVQGLIRALLAGGTQPSQLVAVACRRAAGADQLLAQLPQSVRRDMVLEVHDPADRLSLSYLANSREGKLIHLNRTLCDADVVIPVGRLRPDSSLGYVGVHGGLFPAFSDEETQARFRAPGSTRWAAHRQRRRAEAEEAAWLLGVQLIVQVVPGPGESILRILAGDARAVAEHGATQCAEAWHFSSPSRASLVIATIEGGADVQTWEDFARALDAARRVVDDRGTIVLCTDLHCRPGPALQRLAAARGNQETLNEVTRQRSEDALSASLLCQTLPQHRVYLLSGLKRDQVEQLGVGHIDRADQVQQLCDQHATCLLLPNAHQAIAQADGESAQSSDADHALNQQT